jgi:hypothetical protein
MMRTNSPAAQPLNAFAPGAFLPLGGYPAAITTAMV